MLNRIRTIKSALTQVSLTFQLSHTVARQFFTANRGSLEKTCCIARSLQYLPKRTIIIDKIRYLANQKKIYDLENKLIAQSHIFKQNQPIDKNLVKEMNGQIDELISLSLQNNSGKQYDGQQQHMLQKVQLFNHFRFYEEALQAAEDMLQLNYDESNAMDMTYKGSALTIKSQIESMRGEPQKSLETMITARQILKFSQNDGKSYEMMQCLTRLGKLFYDVGRVQEAIDALEEAAQINEYLLDNLDSKAESGERQKEIEGLRVVVLGSQAITYQQLGSMHGDLRNVEQAQKFYESSCQIWENLEKDEKKKSIAHLHSLNNLGVFYLQHGNSEKGLALMQEQLKRLKPLTQETGELYANAMLALARFYYTQQQVLKSQEYTVEAEQAAKKYGQPHDVLCQVLEHKTNMFVTEKKFDEAMATVQEGLAILRKRQLTRDPLYLRFLFSQALILQNQEQFEQALAIAQVSHDLAMDIFGQWDEQVADALRVLGLARFGIFWRDVQEEKGDNVSEVKKVAKIAFSNLELSAEIFEGIPYRLEDAQSALMELLFQYREFGEFDQAKKILLRIKKVIQEYYKIYQKDSAELERELQGLEQIMKVLDLMKTQNTKPFNLD